MASIKEGPAPVNGSKDLVLDEGFIIKVFVIDPLIGPPGTEQTEITFTVPDERSSRLTVTIKGETTAK